MESEEYPSIRRALFGDEDKAANIWCGVKWVLWHATHLFLLLFLVAVAAVLAIPFAVWYGLNKGADTKPGQKIRETVAAIGSNPKVVRAVRYLLVALTVLLVLGVAVFITAMVVWFLLNDPFALVIGVAYLGGLILAGVGVVVFIEEGLPWVKGKLRGVLEYFGYVREKSEETPVARRVVGYCPVSMDMNPRWFEKILGNR